MFNKNINMPFLGISIIVVVGLIWAAGNFFGIKNGMLLKDSAAPAEIDAAVFAADWQDLAASEADLVFLSQDDALFVENDSALDDISETSDSALDKKSLNEEAENADISGDIKALDNGAVQNEVDQSINDVVQY